MSGLVKKILSDRVLVLPDEVAGKTSSGIYIPDTAKEKPKIGTVIHVGEGKSNDPMVVAVGDKVLYGTYSGAEVELEGKTYLIMRETDIFAIL